MRNRWKKRRSESLPLQLEKDFQQQIIDLARLAGWLVYHTRDSRRSAPGFPDLVLARGQRVIFAELKRSEKETLSDEQETWLKTLRSAQGVETYLWRPENWDEIEQVLARRRVNL